MLRRDEWPDFVFAFHDREAITPRMLARIARRTGLTPDNLSLLNTGISGGPFPSKQPRADELGIASHFAPPATPPLPQPRPAPPPYRGSGPSAKVAAVTTPNSAPASRFALLSAPVQAALFMLLAATLFAGVAGGVRWVTQHDMHALEAAFLRSGFGLLFMLPVILRYGRAAVRFERPGLHLVRGASSAAGTIMWFWAVALLPIAEAVALNFTAPLFTTILAVVVLHEVVRARRWTATVVGFVGVLIVLRPGTQAISPGALLAIGSAATIGINMMLVRILSRTDTTPAIVTSFSFYLTVGTLVPALFVWQTPSWENLLVMLLAGFCGTAAHLAFTRALALGDASAVAPLDFLRLPFAAGVGYLFFAEVPDGWTAVGALVIAGSAAYIARREAVAARREKAAAPA